MTAEIHASNLDEFISSRPESTAPDYLAWRDEKVRRVLAEKATKQPAYTPLDEIVMRFRRNAR